MHRKDEENQLVLNLTTQIILSVVIWLAIATAAGYRLAQLRTITPLLPLVSPEVSVPTLKEEGLNLLRGSIKDVSITQVGPVIRPEPFD